MRIGRQHLLYSIVFSNMLLLLLVCACDTSIKTDDAKVGDALTTPTPIAPSDTFRIDTTRSVITWIGSRITGKHNGIFRLQHGELQVQENKVVGGSLVIDLTTLQATDKTIGEESNRKLSTHLKSSDFFDVEQYPYAYFEIVSVAPYDSTKLEPNQGRVTYSEFKIKNPTHLVTGNLDIKGKVKSLTFPARIRIYPHELTAKANFNIDRSKWGLVYGSDESLGDKTIYPNVNVGFDIIAKP